MSPKTRNDSGLPKIKMKKNNLKELKETIMKEELNSQINRGIWALEGYPSRLGGELRNMRREMDELRIAVKEKAMENLDGMI